MKKQVFIWGALLCLFLRVGYAQNSEIALPNIAPTTPEAAALGKFVDVPVSHYTGVPQIGVPMCGISESGMAIDVSLSYHASGIRVDEIASRVGLGWSLSGQGSITRSVRGIPDDGANGFLNTPATVSAFLAQTLFERVDEINSTVEGNLDYESDIYYYNLPGGASGKFFFRQNGDIVMMPYNQDVKIVPIQDSFNRIVGWEVTLSNGTIYYLGQSKDGTTSVVDRISSGTTTNGSIPMTPVALQLYVSAWHLLEIESPLNSSVTFEYESVGTIVTNFAGERDYIFAFSDTGSEGEIPCPIPGATISFSETETSTHRIKRIIGRTSQLEFTYGQDRLDLIGDAALTRVQLFDITGTGSNLVKQFDLTYGYFNSSATVHASNSNLGNLDQRRKRLYLKDVTQSFGSETDQKYSFQYNTTYILPDRFSFSTDFWGYYNGKNNSVTSIPAVETLVGNSIPGTSFFVDRPGANRKVDVNYTKACSLEKITYPTGGSATYNFESHTVLENHEFFAATEYDSESIINVSTINNNSTDIDIPFTINSGPDGFNFPVNGVTDYVFRMYDHTGQQIPICTTGGFDCPTARILDANNNTVIQLTDNQGALQLDNGNYIIRITNYSGVTNGRIDLTINLSGRKLVDPASPNATFGGLRIKDITLRDSDGSQLLKKSYDYSLFNDANLSSGTAPNPPVFLWYDLPYCSTSASSSVQVTSTPVFPLNNQASYSVGYAQVTESFEGQNLGKTEYSFLTQPNTAQQTNAFFSIFYPNAPLPDISHRRGLLLKQTHYRKNTDASFSPLQETDNTYSFGIGNPAETLEETNVVATIAGNFTGARPYVNISERFYMKAQTQRTYFYQGDTFLDTVSQTTEYFYDSFPTHNQTTKTITTNSDGTVTRVETKYAADLVSFTGYSISQRNAYERLRSASLYRIATPIEVTTYEDAKLLSTQRTLFEDWGNDLILPELVQTAKGSDALEDRLEYTQYDSRGNILEARKSDGSYMTYLWGYNQMYPVAKIDNARLSQVATATGLSTGTLINNGVTNLSVLNNLRTNLPGALISTYTHKPLVGVQTMTDPSGYTMSYEYDAFNRLKRVRDADGNILSENTYHYKNQ